MLFLVVLEIRGGFFKVYAKTGQQQSLMQLRLTYVRRPNKRLFYRCDIRTTVVKLLYVFLAPVSLWYEQHNSVLLTDILSGFATCHASFRMHWFSAYCMDRQWPLAPFIPYFHDPCSRHSRRADSLSLRYCTVCRAYLRKN